MDQLPLLFEFLKGRIYTKRREKTIRLKKGKSGHDKRQYTLQIAVFADGVPRCKPLLMFKGKPKSKDYRRRAEEKRYNPSVIIIFNKKVYANTLNLINQVKNQYFIASIYPLRDNEPRFFTLDAFILYKNKRVKLKENESNTVKVKREKEERL